MKHLVRIFYLLVIFISPVSWSSSGTLEKKLDRKLFDRLYQSDYLYFLSGEPDTKVNFSFGFELSRKYKIDLEYNQTMFWELMKESSPFRDVNFNPKLVKKFNSGDAVLDFGVYEHHSNGIDGINSRSYDSSYLYPKYLITLNQANIYLGAKGRVFYRVGDNNYDIDEYLGNIELSIASTFFFSDSRRKSLKLNISSSPGGDYRAPYKFGYSKVDIVFNPGWRDLPINIHAQVYDGFGESLLGFNERNTSYRMGVSL